MKTHGSTWTFFVLIGLSLLLASCKPDSKVEEPEIRPVRNEQSALRSAEAALTAAQGQLNYRRADFERQRQLLAKGHATRARFDQAQKALQNGQSQVDNAEAQLEMARNRASWTTLTADAEGTATAVGAEPGEVVQARQMIASRQ